MDYCEQCEVYDCGEEEHILQRWKVVLYKIELQLKSYKSERKAIMPKADAIVLDGKIKCLEADARYWGESVRDMECDPFRLVHNTKE